MTAARRSKIPRGMRGVSLPGTTSPPPIRRDDRPAPSVVTRAPSMWLANCARIHPDPSGFECGEGLGQIYMAAVGGPIFVASVIPLAVWSVRLHRHRHARACLQLAGDGLRLAF